MPEPIRTCCACGKKDKKDQLKRFVWSNETILLDQTQGMQGRGAYCCKDEKCSLIFLKQKKKWKRLFRL